MKSPQRGLSGLIGGCCGSQHPRHIKPPLPPFLSNRTTKPSVLLLHSRLGQGPAYSPLLFLCSLVSSIARSYKFLSMYHLILALLHQFRGSLILYFLPFQKVLDLLLTASYCNPIGLLQ